MTTLPTSLVRFRGELEAAIAREQHLRASGRRRRLLRAAVAAGVAAAAVGALAVLPGDPGRRLVEPASAAHRAAAALAGPPGSVVYVDTLVTQRNPDGSRTSWRAESWQRTSPPYDVRRIVTSARGDRVETATVRGSHQSYDARRNTIEIAASEGAAGASTATPQPATAEPFRDQVLELLRSGRLVRIDRPSVGGRETISFVWSDGRTRYEYTVDARTYDPVEWRFAPVRGAGETTVAFTAYEVVDAGDARLDLTYHHPDATVRLRP